MNINKKRYAALLLHLTLITLILSGCGGSGGSGAVGGTEPTVTVNPGNGATGVERKPVITATFDNDMFSGSIDNSTFTLSNGSSLAGTVEFDALTNVATFTSSKDLALLTNYSANLDSAITNLSGDAISAQS